MRRLLLGCVVAAVACIAVSAQAAPTAQDELVAIGKIMSQGTCDVPRIRKLLARKDFLELPSVARSYGYSALGVCDDASLGEASEKATAEPDAIALAWSLRFIDLATRKNMPGALDALHNAVERKGDGTLLPFSDEFLYRVARDLRDDQDGFRRFAAELDRSDWKAAQPYYDGDFIWARYAGLLADAGDATHAWRIGSRVNEPGDLVRMSLDLRFDKIIAVDPQRFDIPAAAETELKRVRALLDANPRDGSAISIATNMLRLLGRQKEALALIDAALAKPGDIRDFQGQDHRNWLINDRALVLMELGSFDEAVDAMEKGAALNERGAAVNVSQTINLAGLQVSVGRFEAALKTLAAADGWKGNVSPYGRMWVAAERACAYQALGRKAEAARELAITAAEAKENEGAHNKALLCAGDLDAVAANYRARLAAPGSRPGALTHLSRFREPPLTAFDAEMSRRIEALRGRPDIQAAVAAVGRTRDFPFQSGSLIDSY